MGGFFSKIFKRNPEGYQQLSNNSPKLNKYEYFYQVSIKEGSIKNEKDKNDKIIKCLQVSDFLERPKNYKIKNSQNGGSFSNFLNSKKKPLFIFCCENTVEAIMTLHFSWIKMIIPKFPILILGSQNSTNFNNLTNNWNTFQFNPRKIKRLAYNSPNFSLKKISLTFVDYKGVSNDPSEIMNYYVKKYKINLADYDGVKLVFVQDFSYRKECELLDGKKNSSFPGIWVNSDFIKNKIQINNNNPLVDGLFLPDFDTLEEVNDLDKLLKLEGYLRFLMMHYSINLKNISNNRPANNRPKFNHIELPSTFFFGYQNMREILKKKINNLKKTQ